MAEQSRYGLIAEYADPGALVRAVHDARRLGYRRVEAYTPFPVEGLDDVLDHRSNRAYGFGVAGAVFGALVGLGMQVYANLSYPIMVGGLPLIALQSFATVTVLLMVGFATLFSLLGLLWLCRLPLLNHPLHEVQAFERATDDRFMLLVHADDPLFDMVDTSLWLAEAAISVSEVPA